MCLMQFLYAEAWDGKKFLECKDCPIKAECPRVKGAGVKERVMDRREYVCYQMYKRHDLLRKGSWTDADKLEYMELNIAPYSRYWRMGMKKALKHAIRLLREEEAKADRKTEPQTNADQRIQNVESVEPTQTKRRE